MNDERPSGTAATTRQCRTRGGRDGRSTVPDRAPEPVANRQGRRLERRPQQVDMITGGRERAGSDRSSTAVRSRTRETRTRTRTRTPYDKVRATIPVQHAPCPSGPSIDRPRSGPRPRRCRQRTLVRLISRHPGRNSAATSLGDLHRRTTGWSPVVLDPSDKTGAAMGRGNDKDVGGFGFRAEAETQTVRTARSGHVIYNSLPCVSPVRTPPLLPTA